MDTRIHWHPLTFKEEKENDRPPQFCNGCLEPVLGPHYTCDTCNNFDWSFNIHKPCAEVPREIHHPIHPKHPLILGENYGRTCGVCNYNQSRRSGYILAYKCSECNFCIDIKCASKWPNDGHEHSFTNIRKPIEFTCDVCGQGDDNLRYNSYICKICQLIVHRECSWLPLRVKISWHQHRLKLTWWFQDMYPKDQNFCHICSESMDGNRALYCCHDHECRDYAAHCKCLRKEGIIMNVLVDGNDDDEPSTSRLPPANETTADDKALQIKHFSHPHMLTLIDGQEVARQDDQDEGITCNGCTLPIIRGLSVVVLMFTPSSSAQSLCPAAVVVLVIRISASDVAVRDATSSYVFLVLNYLLRSGTNTTIILSNSTMLVLKMSSMSTFVTYAKENEIQNIGSTPARIVTLNVILIAFEGGIRKSS
ncbi:unnamed protein product [Malus baccata var. baccata]